MIKNLDLSYNNDFVNFTGEYVIGMIKIEKFIWSNSW